MVTNGTPERWTTTRDWKHGKPTRLVVSGERPDPAQLPETAGDYPPRRRSVSLNDIALLVTAAGLLAGLYLLADWLVKLR